MTGRGFTGVVISSIFLLSACTSADSDAVSENPREVDGISTRAEINVDAGTVDLPLDRFYVKAAEEDQLSTGTGVAMALCAEEKGLTYQVTPASNPEISAIYAQEHYFGPWTQDQAKKWGFAPLLPTNDLIVNGILSEDTPYTKGYFPPKKGERAIYDLTDEEQLILDECGIAGQAFTKAQVQDGGWHREYDPLEFNYTRNAQAVALVEELGKCFSEKGMSPETREGEPWYPQGARADRITEEQITLALKVVECKDSINFTQRMADIESAEQVQLIEKYSAEMIAKRKQIDEALSEANKVISQNPQKILESNPEHTH
ncbi:hypothetical protein [Timonella sp. A28]|uniref:hypothetical protein n=1 Tax=Timonella sp. A28 TaxID=3442640 RepID=UPI003EB97203